MVEGVKELRAKLQAQPLAYLRHFVESEIPIIQTWPRKDAGSGCTQFSEVDLGELLRREIPMVGIRARIKDIG